jgi:hypothetical protein
MTPSSIHTARGAKLDHRSLRGAFWLCFCAFAGLLAVLLPPSARGQSTVSQGTESISMPPRPSSIILPAANRAPDANDRMEMQQQKLKNASYEAANAERKRQLDSDSALILKLASELKAEIDMAAQNTLSLSAMRKAEEIQRLARSVQLKMKLTVGGD